MKQHQSNLSVEVFYFSGGRDLELVFISFLTEQLGVFLTSHQFD
jgi:hypothetical protein